MCSDSKFTDSFVILEIVTFVRCKEIDCDNMEAGNHTGFLRGERLTGKGRWENH